MVVEEVRRHRLHASLVPLAGQEVADTLVELVTPPGHRMATHEDIVGVLEVIARLDERLTAQIAGLRQYVDEQFAAHRAYQDVRFAALREHLDGQLAAHAENADVRFAALREHLDGQLAAHQDNIDVRLTSHRDQLDSRLVAVQGDLKGAFEARLSEEFSRQTRTLLLGLAGSVVAIAAAMATVLGVFVTLT